MDVYELALMSAIATVTAAKRVLEIGTYEGNTALNLAANTPADALIVTVDLPLNWDGELAIKVPQTCVNVFERTNVGRQFHGSQFEAKIRQVLADSKTLNWGELPGPFDMVFVDGCHYFDYVKSDTDNSLRVLRPGGIIVWHDYGAYQDVSRVVDETAKTISLKSLRGNGLSVCFKPSYRALYDSP